MKASSVQRKLLAKCRVLKIQMCPHYYINILYLFCVKIYHVKIKAIHSHETISNNFLNCGASANLPTFVHLEALAISHAILGVQLPIASGLSIVTLNSKYLPPGVVETDIY